MSGVHHCASCTSDVERSLRFWRYGLGLTQMTDYEFIGDWPELFSATDGVLVGLIGKAK